MQLVSHPIKGVHVNKESMFSKFYIACIYLLLLYLDPSFILITEHISNVITMMKSVWKTCNLYVPRFIFLTIIIENVLKARTFDGVLEKTQDVFVLHAGFYYVDFSEF